MVQPLVARFGARGVYEAGLWALGFPPTWIDRAHELIELRQHLELSQER